MNRRESASIELRGGPQRPASGSAVFERHYSPAEIAERWTLSEDAVRKLFEMEPGVLVLATSKPGKRRYRTLRIPETVAQRVHRRLSLSG